MVQAPSKRAERTSLIATPRRVPAESLIDQAGSKQSMMREVVFAGVLELLLAPSILGVGITRVVEPARKALNLLNCGQRLDNSGE
jgi:hypothetical protein